MRLRNRTTGVAVNVRDDKPTLGAEWGPADEPAGPHGGATTCQDCGFVAKTAAGLGSHRRSHDG